MPLKLFLNIVFIFFFFISFGSNESNKPVLKSVFIKPQIFTTEDPLVNIDFVIDSVSESEFVPFKNTSPMLPGKIYWYKIDFSSVAFDDTEGMVIRFPNYDQINVFYQDGDSLLSEVMGKRSNGKKYWIAQDIKIYKGNLIDGKYVYTRIENSKRNTTLGYVACIHPASYDSITFSNHYYTKEVLIQQIIYLLFIGGMSFIVAYFTGIYFMYKDQLYILYVLYLLSLFLYLGSKVEFIEMAMRAGMGFSFSVFHDLIQVVVNIFYLLFASAFFNAKTDYPRLHKGIRYMVIVLLVFMAFLLFLLFSEKYYYLADVAIRYQIYTVILFAFWAYYYILKHLKNKLSLFLVVASLLYITGGLCALFLREVGYMMAGATAEIFIFSLGMGYRMKMIEREKKIVENEIVKTELTALKAQMNPHFIFNSLNSIRAYVITNETKKASDYLTKFSKLIRLILHYSSKENISLKDETEALRLYVQLEELRFREDFGFSVKIDDSLDAETILIPPLILQPYIENAIRHGLSPSEGEKKLILSVLRKEDTLEISISDNGVGRKFHERNPDRGSDHKSVAMELTKRRIGLIKSKGSSQNRVQVNDLYREGQAAGTEVIIILPLREALN